ncbi:MAG: PaRep2b protein [Pseudomonadota bacterium]
MTELAVIRDEGGHTRRIGERGLRIIEQMARDGNSKATIAKALRIGTRTLERRASDDLRVAEALERGYSAMEDELVDILMCRARDPSHKGGVTAAIFLLKARRGYEGTKTPAHITINDNRRQTMLLPSADDMDAYMRRTRDGAAEPVPAIGVEDA